MKNKIYKYDFLVVGAGLIGSLAGLVLHKNNFKVLVIDKERKLPFDKRTLAVNANSKEFLSSLGVWNKLKHKPQPINKIIIKDYINNSPLIFENKSEIMGNVILNSEMLEVARNKLKHLNILNNNIDIDLNKLMPNKPIYINKKKYSFKKIIICVGKNINFNSTHKSIKFNQGHNSYVGFFNHKKNHNNYAYEIFTPHGPLAILPAPANNKLKSTFIYTTKNNVHHSDIQSLINKHFLKSHGKILLEKTIHMFPVKPYLRKENNNFIYVGDSLKSIHPVAGQGWNLGIKDLQKLISLSKIYSLDDENFNSIYYSNRIVENTIYLSFTSAINFLYENKNPFNNSIIKYGYLGLKNINFFRGLFIRQAMGRANLI